MDKTTQQTTPAVAVLVADAKTRLGLDADFADHDNMVTAMLAAATATVEAFTGRQFMQRTVRFWFDLMPSTIILFDAWPVVNIAGGGYIEPDGTIKELDLNTLTTDLVADPAILTLTTLPTVKANTPNVFWVDVVAGYGAIAAAEEVQRAALPAWAVQAIHVQAAAMYENREDKILNIGATTNGQLIKASEYISAPFKRHW